MKKKIPIIICCWHGRLIFPFYYLKNRYFYGIASLHGDAEIIYKIGKNMGWKFIRGSSTRGGKEAYNKMTEILANRSEVVAITPDGPRGPEYKAKAGAIKAGMKTGAVLLPVSGQASRKWEIRNWDTFVIPKPFGRISFVIGEPIYFENNHYLDTATKTLEEALNKVMEKSDALAKK